MQLSFNFGTFDTLKLIYVSSHLLDLCEKVKVSETGCLDICLIVNDFGLLGD